MLGGLMIGGAALGETLFAQADRSFTRMIQAGADGASREELRAAEQAIQEALAAGEQSATCEAMLATVHGFELTRHPWKALWLGPRIHSLYRSALQKGPENPRVLYLTGTGYLRAPARFRDLADAERLLRKAAVLYEAAGDMQGQAQVLWMLGELLEEKGEPGAAELCRQRAHQVRPGFMPSRKGADP